MENKNEDVVVALRLNEKQKKTIDDAAKRSGMKRGTFIKKVALTASGDTRELEVLLRAVSAYLDIDG
jgi:uncharacterized protein (DUF1778 family)